MSYTDKDELDFGDTVQRQTAAATLAAAYISDSDSEDEAVEDAELQTAIDGLSHKLGVPRQSLFGGLTYDDMGASAGRGGKKSRRGDHRDDSIYSGGTPSVDYGSSSFNVGGGNSGASSSTRAVAQQQQLELDKDERALRRLEMLHDNEAEADKLAIELAERQALRDKMKMARALIESKRNASQVRRRNLMLRYGVAHFKKIEEKRLLTFDPTRLHPRAVAGAILVRLRDPKDTQASIKFEDLKYVFDLCVRLQIQTAQANLDKEATQLLQEKQAQLLNAVSKANGNGNDSYSRDAASVSSYSQRNSIAISNNNNNTTGSVNIAGTSAPSSSSAPTSKESTAGRNAPPRISVTAAANAGISGAILVDSQPSTPKGKGGGGGTTTATASFANNKGDSSKPLVVVSRATAQSQFDDATIYIARRQAHLAIHSREINASYFVRGVSIYLNALKELQVVFEDERSKYNIRKAMAAVLKNPESTTARQHLRNVNKVRHHHEVMMMKKVDKLIKAEFLMDSEIGIGADDDDIFSFVFEDAGAAAAAGSPSGADEDGIDAASYRGFVNKVTNIAPLSALDATTNGGGADLSASTASFLLSAGSSPLAAAAANVNNGRNNHVNTHNSPAIRVAAAADSDPLSGSARHQYNASTTTTTTTATPALGPLGSAIPTTSVTSPSIRTTTATASSSTPSLSATTSPSSGGAVGANRRVEFDVNERSIGGGASANHHHHLLQPAALPILQQQGSGNFQRTMSISMMSNMSQHDNRNGSASSQRDKHHASVGVIPSASMAFDGSLVRGGLIVSEKRAAAAGVMSGGGDGGIGTTNTTMRRTTSMLSLSANSDHNNNDNIPSAGASCSTAPNSNAAAGGGGKSGTMATIMAATAEHALAAAQVNGVSAADLQNADHDFIDDGMVATRQGLAALFEAVDSSDVRRISWPQLTHFLFEASLMERVGAVDLDTKEYELNDMSHYEGRSNIRAMQTLMASEREIRKRGIQSKALAQKIKMKNQEKLASGFSEDGSGLSDLSFVTFFEPTQQLLVGGADMWWVDKGPGLKPKLKVETIRDKFTQLPVYSVICMSYVHTLRILAVSCTDSTVKFYHISAGNVVAPKFLTSTPFQCNQTAVFFRGETLYTGSRDGELATFALKYKFSRGLKVIKVHQAHPHKNIIRKILEVKHEKCIVTCSLDHSIQMHDSKSLRHVHTFEPGHTRGVVDMAFCDALNVLVSIAFDGVPYVWSLSLISGPPSVLQDGNKGHKHIPVSVVAIEHHRAAATMDRGGTVKIWDLKELFCMQTIHIAAHVPPAEQSVRFVQMFQRWEDPSAMSPLGCMTLYCISQKRIFTLVYNQSQSKVVLRNTADDDQILSAAWCPWDLSYITISGTSVKTWDGETCAVRDTFKFNGKLKEMGGSTTAAAVHPVGRQYYLGTANGSLLAQSSSTGMTVYECLKAHSSAVKNILYCQSPRTAGIGANLSLDAVVSLSDDRAVLTTGELKDPYPLIDVEHPRCLAYDTETAMLLIGDTIGTITAYQLGSFAPCRGGPVGSTYLPKALPREISCMCVLSGEQAFVAADDEGHIAAFTQRTADRPFSCLALWTHVNETNGVPAITAMAFDSERYLLYCGDEQGFVTIYNLYDMLRIPVPQQGSPSLSAGFTRNPSNLSVTASGAGRITPTPSFMGRQSLAERRVTAGAGLSPNTRASLYPTSAAADNTSDNAGSSPMSYSSNVRRRLSVGATPVMNFYAAGRRVSVVNRWMAHLEAVTSVSLVFSCPPQSRGVNSAAVKEGLSILNATSQAMGTGSSGGGALGAGLQHACLLTSSTDQCAYGWTLSGARHLGALEQYGRATIAVTPFSISHDFRRVMPERSAHQRDARVDTMRVRLDGLVKVPGQRCVSLIPKRMVQTAMQSLLVGGIGGHLLNQAFNAKASDEVNNKSNSARTAASANMRVNARNVSFSPNVYGGGGMSPTRSAGGAGAPPPPSDAYVVFLAEVPSSSAKVNVSAVVASPPPQQDSSSASAAAAARSPVLSSSAVSNNFSSDANNNANDEDGDPTSAGAVNNVAMDELALIAEIFGEAPPTAVQLTGGEAHHSSSSSAQHGSSKRGGNQQQRSSGGGNGAPSSVLKKKKGSGDGGGGGISVTVSVGASPLNGRPSEPIPTVRADGAGGGGEAATAASPPTSDYTNITTTATVTEVNDAIRSLLTVKEKEYIQLIAMATSAGVQSVEIQKKQQHAPPTPAATNDSRKQQQQKSALEQVTRARDRYILTNNKAYVSGHPSDKSNVSMRPESGKGGASSLLSAAGGAGGGSRSPSPPKKGDPSSSSGGGGGGDAGGTGNAGDIAGFVGCAYIRKGDPNAKLLMDEKGRKIPGATAADYANYGPTMLSLAPISRNSSQPRDEGGSSSRSPSPAIANGEAASGTTIYNSLQPKGKVFSIDRRVNRQWAGGGNARNATPEVGALRGGKPSKSAAASNTISGTTKSAKKQSVGRSGGRNASASISNTTSRRHVRIRDVSSSSSSSPSSAESSSSSSASSSDGDTVESLAFGGGGLVEEGSYEAFRDTAGKKKGKHANDGGGQSETVAFAFTVQNSDDSSIDNTTNITKSSLDNSSRAFGSSEAFASTNRGAGNAGEEDGSMLGGFKGSFVAFSSKRSLKSDLSDEGGAEANTARGRGRKIGRGGGVFSSSSVGKPSAAGASLKSAAAAAPTRLIDVIEGIAREITDIRLLRLQVERYNDHVADQRSMLVQQYQQQQHPSMSLSAMMSGMGMSAGRSTRLLNGMAIHQQQQRSPSFFMHAAAQQQQQQHNRSPSMLMISPTLGPSVPHAAGIGAAVSPPSTSLSLALPEVPELGGGGGGLDRERVPAIAIGGGTPAVKHDEKDESARASSSSPILAPSPEALMAMESTLMQAKGERNPYTENMFVGNALQPFPDNTFDVSKGFLGRQCGVTDGAGKVVPTITANPNGSNSSPAANKGAGGAHRPSMLLNFGASQSAGRLGGTLMATPRRSSSFRGAEGLGGASSAVDGGAVMDAPPSPLSSVGSPARSGLSPRRSGGVVGVAGGAEGISLMSVVDSPRPSAAAAAVVGGLSSAALSPSSPPLQFVTSPSIIPTAAMGGPQMSPHGRSMADRQRVLLQDMGDMAVPAPRLFKGIAVDDDGIPIALTKTGKPVPAKKKKDGGIGNSKNNNNAAGGGGAGASERVTILQKLQSDPKLQLGGVGTSALQRRKDLLLLEANNATTASAQQQQQRIGGLTESERIELSKMHFPAMGTHQKVFRVTSEKKRKEERSDAAEKQRRIAKANATAQQQGQGQGHDGSDATTIVFDGGMTLRVDGVDGSGVGGGAADPLLSSCTIRSFDGIGEASCSSASLSTSALNTGRGGGGVVGGGLFGGSPPATVVNTARGVGAAPPHSVTPATDRRNNTNNASSSSGAKTRTTAESSNTANPSADDDVLQLEDGTIPSILDHPEELTVTQRAVFAKIAHRMGHVKEAIIPTQQGRLLRRGILGNGYVPANAVFRRVDEGGEGEEGDIQSPPPPPKVAALEGGHEALPLMTRKEIMRAHRGAAGGGVNNSKPSSSPTTTGDSQLAAASAVVPSSAYDVHHHAPNALGAATDVLLLSPERDQQQARKSLLAVALKQRILSRSASAPQKAAVNPPTTEYQQELGGDNDAAVVVNPLPLPVDTSLLLSNQTASNNTMQNTTAATATATATTTSSLKGTVFRRPLLDNDLLESEGKSAVPSIAASTKPLMGGGGGFASPRAGGGGADTLWSATVVEATTGEDYDPTTSSLLCALDASPFARRVIEMLPPRPATAVQVAMMHGQMMAAAAQQQQQREDEDANGEGRFAAEHYNVVTPRRHTIGGVGRNNNSSAAMQHSSPPPFASSSAGLNSSYSYSSQQQQRRLGTSFVPSLPPRPSTSMAMLGTPTSTRVDVPIGYVANHTNSNHDRFNDTRRVPGSSEGARPASSQPSHRADRGAELSEVFPTVNDTSINEVNYHRNSSVAVFSNAVATEGQSAVVAGGTGSRRPPTTRTSSSSPMLSNRRASSSHTAVGSGGSALGNSRPVTSNARHRQALVDVTRRPVLLLNSESGPQLDAFPARGIAKTPSGKRSSSAAANSSGMRH